MASRRLALGSLVQAKTKPEAERVGKYMIRPILSLERLTFLEPEGKVGYRYGQYDVEQKRMDYLEFINHLRLTFVAERPPPPEAAFQELLMAADPPAEYFP